MDNSKYKTGDINIVCLSVGLGECGHWMGLLLRGPLGKASRVAKSHTVKKVYKLYCSTHRHTHLWIGKST